MKKINITIGFIILQYLILFNINGALSQEKNENYTLLWEISGKKLTKPSHLYGTIHIQDKRVFDYDDIVKQKFDECEAYAMEILMDEIDAEILQKSMLWQKILQNFLKNKPLLMQLVPLISAVKKVLYIC